jgi:dihydroorotate dehydrogenase
MYQLIKPLLFFLSPEIAHTVALGMFRVGLRIPFFGQTLVKTFRYESDTLSKNVGGLHFPNPVGLAAGFDKNGEYTREMAALGFGFLELGTVTPRPQAGNPRPRLFRLPADSALINRMGFNNEGAEALAARLKQWRPPGVIIGGNIGKNKSTPNEEAIRDYAFCFECLYPVVDYFVVNVSSPNTPGLRALQEREPLESLLRHLQHMNHQKSTPKPIFLKIAPDLAEKELMDIVDLVAQTHIAGVIAANTTTSRSGLNTSVKHVDAIGPGGLSGEPVRKRSTEMIRFLRQNLPERVAIIGVGGISSPEDAIEKLDAGADLIQIYTGLVYKGPGLIRQIKKALKINLT